MFILVQYQVPLSFSNFPTNKLQKEGNAGGFWTMTGPNMAQLWMVSLVDGKVDVSPSRNMEDELRKKRGGI